MSKQALSSRGVWVGVNTSEVIRRVATKMVERQERAEQKLREERSKWAYETRESVVALVKRVDNGKESSLPLYTATTVTEVGNQGQITTRPERLEFLESQLRLDLARAYQRAGLVASWDEARQRSSLARLTLERSLALEVGSGA